jgi:hypothetical protein
MKMGVPDYQVCLNKGVNYASYSGHQAVSLAWFWQ